MAVHQLLPELAADIAEVGIVVFVDAVVAIDSPAPNITIAPIIASPKLLFPIFSALLAIWKAILQMNDED